MQLRLSLTELDRRFAYISEGKAYHGEAVNPKGLSLWERMMGFSKVSFVHFLTHYTLSNP